MIRLGQVGMGSLSLPGLLRAEQSTSKRRSNKRTKSCILIYLWGGPPQQDTFDMKPDAPEGIRSEFKPIDTVVPGIRICDQLPMIAKHTDKLAIIRSLSHRSNNHEPSVYHTLTGKVSSRQLVVPRNQRNRRDFPNVAGVVSYHTKPSSMPSSVTIPRPIGHDGAVYAGTYAGFLGPRYDAMELQPPAEVNVPAPHSLELPPELTSPRLLARRGLLTQLESYQQRMDHSRNVKGLDASREQAFRMLTSTKAKTAFQLEREPDRVRERYGTNEYGECFLLARRLIEAGVRLVTLTWYYVCPNGNVANVWDNHGGTGSLGGITGYEMLKKFYCLPSLDRGYSALIEDLQVRGLLDDTLVAMFGEFGRTPKINKKGGRDHWGACQSAVLAGSGIKGGQVYGSTDKQAAYVSDNPVSPEDLHATMYQSLGIPTDNEIRDPEGRVYRITNGTPIRDLF